MSRHSPIHHLFKKLIFLWILGKATHRAFAQQTNVTCDRAFDWANNSKGQSPCLVAAYLQGECYPDKKWNVTSLPPGAQYLAPSGNVATGCACSSPVYSLVSACAACQGASYVTWGQWTANCPPGMVNNGTFPFQVPADTTIPQWALTAITSNSYFDPDAAKGGQSADAGLSGATIFLIVLLPVMLLSLGAFGLWILWKRKHRAEQEGNAGGHEPLLRHAGGSRHTFLTVDTASDVYIHLTRKSADSAHAPYGYDKSWAQASPVPATPESGDYSPHPSPAPSSPGAQYAHNPETPVYHPHQQYLVPPSATSAGFGAPLRSATPSQSQPPLTGATTQTFASQMGPDPSRQSYQPVDMDEDSGTFPRTPVEPQLPSLPLGDPRRLLPPSVLANAPSTT